jgi:hypothetical protein
MVAHQHKSARSTRRRRTRAPQEQAEPIYTPDSDALSATIRALWAKERRLGCYSPAEELGLDLEALEIEALRALRARIQGRLHAHVQARMGEAA